LILALYPAHHFHKHGHIDSFFPIKLSLFKEIVKFFGVTLCDETFGRFLFHQQLLFAKEVKGQGHMEYVPNEIVPYKIAGINFSVHGTYRNVEIARLTRNSAEIFARKTLFKKVPSNSSKFHQETMALSCLVHPHIIDLVGTYSHNGTTLLVQPFADETFESFLNSKLKN
jgi:hypothetical protein